MIVSQYAYSIAMFIVFNLFCLIGLAVSFYMWKNEVEPKPNSFWEWISDGDSEIAGISFGGLVVINLLAVFLLLVAVVKDFIS